MMISYLGISLSRQPVVNYNIPDLFHLTGGRALIPKNAFGWPTLSGLVYERVGSFSSPFSNFYFRILFSTYRGGRSLPAARSFKARRRPSSSAGFTRPRR